MSLRPLVFVIRTVRSWERLVVILFGASVASCGSCSTSAHPQDRLASLSLPQGFSIAVFAERVPNARAMVLSPGGTLYVGSREEGAVYAVRDDDGDATADRVVVVDEGLAMPAGVDLRDGDLYVSAISRILRYDDIDARFESSPEPVVVTDAFPNDRHHGWKFIRFGPDGLLYVPVGAPCNICDSPDPYASIMRMAPDGSNREVYARGIRNTVGFDWHPDTGVLYFTENGGDNMGNDIPPDELNRVTAAGQHFGYPHCHGAGIVDPDHGAGHDCGDYMPPLQALGPHVAALGMRFYTGSAFPPEYRGAIFIAEHGSWNRDTPIGYRVMVVKLDESGAAVSYEPFVTGWLDDATGDAWGRPADVLVHSDGSLLVSDDEAGKIYRITYAGSR